MYKERYAATKATNRVPQSAPMMRTSHEPVKRICKHA